MVSFLDSYPALLVLTLAVLAATLFLGRWRSCSIVLLPAGMALTVASCNPLTLLQCAGLFLLSVCYTLTTMPRWWFSGMAILVTSGVVLLGIGPSRFAMRRAEELAKLQTEYPLVSLRSRLAYEAALQSGDFPPRTVGAAEESGVAEERMQFLAQRQVDWRLSARLASLERLHDEQYERFVSSPGFGSMRMIYLDPEDIRLPPPPAVQIECERTPDLSNDLGQIASTRRLPSSGSLRTLHWLGAGDFVAEGRLGYVRSLDEVAGFQSHAFSRLPEHDDIEEWDWQIASLELISLLKHETPRAYESEFLPNMELLASADVPTRELDEFETAALQQLDAHADVVIDDAQPGVIRMLGSLRANETCLRCHSVARGQLLGAFTYRLIPQVDASGNRPEDPGDRN